MRSPFLAVTAAASLTACFDPTYRDPTCAGLGSPCPDGLECHSNVCVLPSSIDAAPQGCYIEQDETGNDELSEETITLGDKVAEICGLVRPGEPSDGGVLDTDHYSFVVSTDPLVTKDLVVRVAADLPEHAGAVRLRVAGAGSGVLEGGNALGFVTSASTTQTFSVIAESDAALDSQFGYRVSFFERVHGGTCLPGAAEYTEMRDTAENLHRGNDVTVLSSLSTQATLDPTVDAADEPEPSDSVAVGFGPPLTLAGTVVDADPAYENDGFRDRDTYAIRTGPETTLLDVHVTWVDQPKVADEADLDWGLARASDGTMLAAMTFGAFDREHGVVAVAPDTLYYLVVANYPRKVTVTKPYLIGLCGETLP